MQFICITKCTTCHKAKKWLEDHDIPYENPGYPNKQPDGGGIAALA